jgi:sugar/nucleoside kinase (ribokinase family)
LIPPLDFYFKLFRDFNPSASLILRPGAEGAHWYEPGGDRIGSHDGGEVDLDDSIGAGDTFIAALIWAKGKLKKSVKESTEMAVKLATRKVAQERFDGVLESI